MDAPVFEQLVIYIHTDSRHLAFLYYKTIFPKRFGMTQQEEADKWFWCRLPKQRTVGAIMPNMRHWTVRFVTEIQWKRMKKDDAAVTLLSQTRMNRETLRNAL